MTAATRSSALRFSTEDTIVAYLMKHPRTAEMEKKIIQLIAKFFANREYAESGIDLGVALTVCDLGLAEGAALRSIQFQLAQALKDCANGKLIGIK